MSALLIERLHFSKGIDPAANPWASTVYSDVVNMKEWYRVLFVGYAGAGTTGTTTVTVLACDDVSHTNSTAITFRYREILSGDTEGTLTAATTAGFLTTAGSSRMWLVEVDASPPPPTRPPSIVVTMGWG